MHGLTRDDLARQAALPRSRAESSSTSRAAANGSFTTRAFDVAFFDYEFDLCGFPRSTTIYGRLVDTLALARETFPGKRNNLDALCERFGVSNAQRTLHGALLDAQLLAEVYLAMTRGQETLIIDMQMPVGAAGRLAFGARDSGADGMPRYVIHCIMPDAAELAAHRNYLEALARESKAGCLWLALEQELQTKQAATLDAAVEAAELEVAMEPAVIADDGADPLASLRRRSDGVSGRAAAAHAPRTRGGGADGHDGSPRLPADCRILVSPAVRAQQTAAGAWPAIRNRAPNSRRVRSVGDVLRVARWPDADATTLIVGHEPTLGRSRGLAARWATGGRPLKKGAVVWLAHRPPADATAVLEVAANPGSVGR